MADAIQVFLTLLGAVVAGGLSTGLGYFSKTKLEPFEGYKFVRTVIYAVFLTVVGFALKLPTGAPELAEAKLVELGVYAAFVYATETAALAFYRRVWLPAKARLDTLKGAPA